MRLSEAFQQILPSRGTRLLAAAAIAALAGACASSQPEFDNRTYTTTASSRIYEEAFDHLQANYIQRVDLRDISVAGVSYALPAPHNKVRTSTKLTSLCSVFLHFVSNLLRPL